MDASLRRHATSHDQQQQQQYSSRGSLSGSLQGGGGNQRQQQQQYQQQSGLSASLSGSTTGRQQYQRQSGLSASLSGNSSQRHHQQQHHHHHQQQHQQYGADYMSVGSHYSQSSVGSQKQDEAYRRLGIRLSRSAHGDGPFPRPQRLSRIGLTPASGFGPYGESSSKNSSSDGGEGTDAKQDQSPATALNRTNKVAKTRYSDHGDHHGNMKRAVNGDNVLRKMTINAKELFRLWHAEAKTGKGRKKRASPTGGAEPARHNSKEGKEGGVSPQRFAFSQLALDNSSGQQKQQQQQQPGGQSSHRSHNQSDDQFNEHFFSSSNSHADNNKLGSVHGHVLLDAVLESSSQTSTPATNKTNDNGSLKSMNSRTSSIATAPSLRTLPPGKCLTQPSEPVANDGSDNVEGNLIAHENDTLNIGRKQIHVLTKDKMKGATRADFRIQSLLGQGTFAQVFQCLHLQTGNLVAVKIVKNKPAYTRQAAVEIDVFRALVKKTDKHNNVSSSQSHQARASSPSGASTADASVSTDSGDTKWDCMVDLVCYFMHKNHLCLVFEILGLNLYEVLKKRQFRGLPLPVVRNIVKQAVGGIKELAKKSIVHCDLKPENILLVNDEDVESLVSAGESRRLGSSLDKSGRSYQANSVGKGRNIIDQKSMGEPPMNSTGTTKMVEGNPGTMKAAAKAREADLSHSPTHSLETNGTAGTTGMSMLAQKIKLIDFGSACFEGQTSHTYIQSRFYRSPEVLVGQPYDSGIDMWSLGCVAAELFLGLPILPGVHEHDQLSRICEMIANLPDWMLDQGSKASKYFVKYVPRSEGPHIPTPTPPPPTPPPGANNPSPFPRPLPQWRLRTQQEYIASLSQSEIRKKGGLAKLEKQPGNRYFKRKKLADIIMHKGMSGTPEDREQLELFIHFLYGILDPDPWKRWTAFQATSHPFLTGGPVERRGRPTLDLSKEKNQANSTCNIYWDAPWDPNICRRKLLNVQKLREKQQTGRRGYSNTRSHNSQLTRQFSGSSHESANVLDSPSRGPTGRRSEEQNQPNMQQQGLGAVMASQAQLQRGGYQMSSSLSEYANARAGQFAGDASSVVSASQMYPGGPQSFNDMGYAGTFPGSMNEVDFAYALQRPGVVPMGDSIASSFDMRSVQSLQQQQQLVGSYGSHQRGRTDQLGSAMSRSVDQMQDMPGGDPRGLMNNVAYGSYSQQQLQYGNNANYGGQVPSGTGQRSGDSISGMINPGSLDGSLPGDFQQQALAYGNAQAFIQQQHEALRQQQALLQQQQAALVLQQQALQQQQQQQQYQYGMNPGMISGQQQQQQQNAQFGAAGMSPYGQMPGQMPGHMPGQMPGQMPGGGYYYVSSQDGTNSVMMMPNQGGQAGMGAPYGMAPPQQQQQQQMYPNGNGGGQGFNPPQNPQNFQGGMSM